MTRSCDWCRLSLGRAGHGHVHGLAVVCANCEWKWRDDMARKKLTVLRDSERLEPERAQVARKVREWRTRAAA